MLIRCLSILMMPPPPSISRLKLLLNYLVSRLDSKSKIARVQLHEYTTMCNSFCLFFINGIKYDGQLVYAMGRVVECVRELFFSYTPYNKKSASL